MSILAISEPAPRWPTILAASWMDEYSMPQSALLLPSLTLADIGHDEAPVPGLIILLYYPKPAGHDTSQIIFKGACH